MSPRTTGIAVSCRDLMLEGCAASVPDDALLALVIGDDGSASRELLARYGEPEALWRVAPEELVALPGIGPTKAARVLACLEMSRRAGAWRCGKRPHIATPQDVVALCWPQMRGASREMFWALALNTKNHLLRTIEVSIGSLNASIVHPRELFREAVTAAAASIVVTHNHPSGDPTPSGADIQLTRRLVKAGDVMGIEVLDHVIIGDDGTHTSMRDLGLM